MTDWAWFTEAFGAAVADVRAKLVDEAWFGRRSPASDRAHSQTPEHEPDRSAPNPWELDRGIDR